MNLINIFFTSLKITILLSLLINLNQSLGAQENVLNKTDTLLISFDNPKDTALVLRSSSTGTPNPLGTDFSVVSNVNQMAPVSPNAASLGRFGAMPVGHYTGTPNISIPVYEMDLDGKKIPVSISYHASGIKVAQEASVIGLGWALNAGGCITKEIKGWDDFRSYPNGYYHSSWSPQCGTENYRIVDDWAIWSRDEHEYYRHMENEWEREPDLFHFNFAAFSGTMFFDLNNTGENTNSIAKAIIQNEKNYLDTRFYIYENAWVITDASGFKYYFNTHENTISYQERESSNHYFTAYRPVDRKEIQPEVTTAWFLDSIVSPKKKVIKFNYDIESVFSIPTVNERIYFSSTFANVSHNLQHYDQYIKNYDCASSVNQQALLKSISFDDILLKFAYSDRSDIESALPGVMAKKLTEISIQNLNLPIKRITFRHSYLGNINDYSKCRLMLDTVFIKGGICEESYKYSLTYNRGELPAKNSVSWDYWGYYNGAGSPGFGEINRLDKVGFYFMLSPPTLRPGGVYVPGVDKNPNETLMQHGMLTGVTYPTGGKTTFEYEPHTFYNRFETLYKLNLKELSYAMMDNGSPMYPSPSYPFTVESGMYTSLFYTYRKYDNTNTELQYAKIRIEKKSGDQFVLFKESWIELDKTNEMNTIPIYLNQGTYRMDLTMPDETFPGEFWVLLTGYLKKMLGVGGGLRIRQITDLSESNNINKKIFHYNGDGALMVVPEYHKDVYFIIPTSQLTPSDDPISGFSTYFYGSNSPVSSLSSSSLGGHVGYHMVDEKQVDANGQDNGKTKYTFVNLIDEQVNLHNAFILNYPGIPNLNNGSPLEISYYDKQSRLLKKKSYEYTLHSRRSVKGLKVQTIPLDMAFIRFYDLYSERWQLSKEVDTEYFENSIQPMITTTEYQYNQGNLLNNYTKTVINSSLIEDFTKYPNDYSDPVSLAMCSRSMIDVPLEQITSKDGDIISGRKTLYKDTLGMYLPLSIQMLNISGPASPTNYAQHYKEELGLSDYNSKGNVGQQKTEAGKVVYLWSYYNKEVVAVIRNASYGEVETVLGAQYIEALSRDLSPDMDALNELLRTEFADRDVMISTYTYQPMVGLTSETNPQGITTHYGYDCLNRLKEVYIIENGMKKVIKSYEYYYREN